MALTQRFFRLFQADLHGVLDRLEEPEVLLKQALREMEEELQQGELRLKRLSRESLVITRRQAELSESRDRVEQELDLCFQADNEVLARTLLKRKLAMEKLSTYLTKTHQELETNLREQRVQLAQNCDHYESVRQKTELLAQENQVNSTLDGGDPSWRSLGFGVRDDEVDIALLKEKERRSISDGETS